MPDDITPETVTSDTATPPPETPGETPTTPPTATETPPAELGNENPPSEDAHTLTPPADPPATTPPDAPGEAETPPETPEPEPAGETVPLARLQGVQRQLSVTERDRDSWKGRAQVLQEQLTAAERLAATERRERLIATHTDIVPSLINGETVDQVNQSLIQSQASYAAARAAVARQIPTPGNLPAAHPPAQPAVLPASPIDDIRAGLSANRSAAGDSINS